MSPDDLDDLLHRFPNAELEKAREALTRLEKLVEAPGTQSAVEPGSGTRGAGRARCMRRTGPRSANARPTSY